MTWPLDSKIEGCCVCEAVKFEVCGPFHSFYFCHCSRCRRSGGSAHAANLFSGVNSVTWITGKEQRIQFELSEQSYFNKCFCRICGSPLPRRAKSGEFMIVPAGALGDSLPLLPSKNIFWADRALWFEAGTRAPKHDQY